MSVIRAPDVLLLGDPRLRVACESVVLSDFDDESFCLQVAKLQETLETFRSLIGFGRGIAAPQIGFPKRCVAFHLRPKEGCDEDQIFVAYNPVIRWKSETYRVLFDDCMSLPDLLVKVMRHESVTVAYQNESFEEVVMERLPFDLSELMQHELDHLDGILMTDRAVPGKDSIIYKESRKLFE